MEILWDILITLGSLALALWFILIEPIVHRWRAARAARQLPPPRNPPMDGGNSKSDFNDMIRSLVPPQYRVPERPEPSGTDGNQGAPLRTGTTHTSDDKEDDKEIEDLIRRGYSANQIVSIVGGNRSSVLKRVKNKRREMGV